MSQWLSFFAPMTADAELTTARRNVHGGPDGATYALHRTHVLELTDSLRTQTWRWSGYVVSGRQFSPASLQLERLTSALCFRRQRVLTAIGGRDLRAAIQAGRTLGEQLRSDRRIQVCKRSPTPQPSERSAELPAAQAIGRQLDQIAQTLPRDPSLHASLAFPVLENLCRVLEPQVRPFPGESLLWLHALKWELEILHGDDATPSVGFTDFIVELLKPEQDRFTAIRSGGVRRQRGPRSR